MKTIHDLTDDTRYWLNKVLLWSDENWSEERRDEVVIGVTTGLLWWLSAAEVRGDPVPDLSFNINVHDPFITPNDVAVTQEPIQTRAQTTLGNVADIERELAWIGEIMTNVGAPTEIEVNGLLPYYETMMRYIDQQRAANNRQWGFVVFVVDSLNDAAGSS